MSSMLAAMLAGLESANIFASSIICFKDISNPASSWGRRKFSKLYLVYPDHLSFLMRDQTGETLTAGSDVLEDIRHAAPGVHRERPHLLVEVPRCSVQVRQLLTFALVKSPRTLCMRIGTSFKSFNQYLLISVGCRFEGHCL